jgi:recombination protein RecT
MSKTGDDSLTTVPSPKKKPWGDSPLFNQGQAEQGPQPGPTVEQAQAILDAPGVSQAPLPAVAKLAKAPVKKSDSLADFIRSPYMLEQIQMALPKFMTPDRFLRVAYTAFNKTPKLQQCSRASIAMSLLNLASVGLEPDGRHAHLIPFNSQKEGMVCTTIIDYKGKISLAMRSGMISNIHADKICDNDVFEYDKGEIKKHIIDFRKDRGKPYAYYVIIKFKDGSEKCEVMTDAECEAIRKRSKSPNAGPWVTDRERMCLKTVFHRASNWIPQTPEMAIAHELEDGELADNKKAAAQFAQLPEPEAPETASDGLAEAAVE